MTKIVYFRMRTFWYYLFIWRCIHNHWIFPLHFVMPFSILPHPPTTEFCKSAATATTLTAETTMNRAFCRVVAALFFMRKKGLLPPLLLLFYSKTNERRGRYMKRRMTTYRKKAEGTATQKPDTGLTERSTLKDKALAATLQESGCGPAGLRFHTAKATVTIRQNCSCRQTEPKLQPDGTKVST